MVRELSGSEGWWERGGGLLLLAGLVAALANVRPAPFGRGLTGNAAILKFAINASVEGINLDMVGVILMLAGAVVLLFGLFYEARWSDRLRRRDRVVVEERVDPRP